jgi:hypothetical protein
MDFLMGMGIMVLIYLAVTKNVHERGRLRSLHAALAQYWPTPKEECLHYELAAGVIERAVEVTAGEE